MSHRPLVPDPPVWIIERAGELIEAGRVPQEWEAKAVCRGRNPNDYFPVGGDSSKYIALLRCCRTCPVAGDCLAAALLEERGVGRRYVHGIRGGMIPRHRVSLARMLGLRRGDVDRGAVA